MATTLTVCSLSSGRRGEAVKEAGRHRVHGTVDAFDDRAVARRFVINAHGPDEDNLFVGVGLGERRRCRREMFTELGFTEVVDDTGDTEAQVQEIDALASFNPGQDLVAGAREILGCIRKVIQRDRTVEVRRHSERQCKDHKIGAPGHARRIEIPIRIVLPRDDIC